MNLIVRGGVGLDGAPLDLAVQGGTIVAVLGCSAGAVEIDATRKTVLPGLHDHHIHLLATAARRCSVDLAGCLTIEQVAARLSAANAGADLSEPLRAVGYDERAAGLLDRDQLDIWAPQRPLRILDRTGALWVLNGAALDLLPPGDLPSGAERDGEGRLTGRFWREDPWLRGHFPAEQPRLDMVGHELARLGVTGVTDAGWHNGPAEAQTLSAAHLRGDLPQRLTIMGGETLPIGFGYTQGPLKLMIDERDPPAIEKLAQRIATARQQQRAVAAHCVSAVEIALYLAALDAAGGARCGDRIEHGGMITDAALATIATAALTVVTNPGFIHDRGDRYRETIPESDWGDLYRAAALVSGGVPLAAGSDAPYASADPWLAMRAARDRRTAQGQDLAPQERLSARRAFSLYVGRADDPGGRPRRLVPGEPADFIICDGNPGEVLADLTADHVETTVIAGEVVFSRGGAT